MTTESTEGMLVPDALRAIAGWIEEGREIESKSIKGFTRGFEPESRSTRFTTQNGHVELQNYIYRIIGTEGSGD